MSANSLVFNKGKAIDRLAFVSESARFGPRISMFVQAVLLVLAAVLTAKTFLVDYPASPRFLEPTTIMSFETAGGLSVLAFVYWFLSGMHLRVTNGRLWHADGAFGLLVVVVAAVLFAFGISHSFTNVFMKYVYADLIWFVIAFLGVSVIPWISGTRFVIGQRRPLRLFLLSGLLNRAVFLVGAIVLACFFAGSKIYDEQVSRRILAMAGFDNPLHGFLSILWFLLFLIAFGCVAGLVTVTTFGIDALTRSTFKSGRTVFFAAFCTALVTFSYLLDHASVTTHGSLVWLCLAIPLGLAMLFLLANRLLKIVAMPALMRTLSLCLQLLIVIIVSFALQYFVQASEIDRAFAYVLTVPSLLFMCAHLYLTGVGAAQSAQRPMILVLSAASSSALTYFFLVISGFVSLLPGEIPAKNLFNFILIASVLFAAILACCKLLLATNGATRLLALRAGLVPGGER